MVGENSRRIFGLTLLVLGAYSQIGQALLVREDLVVFYGNEVTLGAFYGSWLLWIVLGSLAVVHWRDRPWVRKPTAFLRWILLALPWLMAAQIMATRSVRLLLEVSPTELVPLGQLFIAVLFITAPTSLALGLAFPLACRAVRAAPGDDRDVPGTVSAVSHLYIFESFGALLGGVLFTFVLVEWLGLWPTLGVVSLVLAGTAMLLGSARWPARFMAAALGVAGLLLALSPLNGWIESRAEALRFRTLQPGLSWVDAIETRYGHLAVGRSGEQYSLVSDGRITESFPDAPAAEQAAAYFYSQAKQPGRVLMFGGAASGLADALLGYPVQRIDVVEQDRRAFERVRGYLPDATRRALADPRLHLVFQDGRRFANSLTGEEHYDLVLALQGDPSSAHSNRYFTVDFYEAMRAAMAADGVLCTAVSSASNYLGRDVKSYSGSVYHTLHHVFSHIAVRPGDEHVYCAAGRPGVVTEDAAELERRYRAVALEPRPFPAESFYSLLPPDRIDYIREQFDREIAELNTDQRPVTYYLNMLLWGKFSASQAVSWLEGLRRMGPWPYLVPLVVGVGLILLRAALAGFRRPRLRRESALLVLAVLGLAAMAVELTLMFGYQARVGYVFSRLALLNGLFMTGLALGAGVLGQRLSLVRRPGLALALVMVTVALGTLLLPPLLEHIGRWDTPLQEAVYLGLCGCAGLITGAGFPLGVNQAHRDTEETVSTSGLSEAADSFGGAFGGLLTGAVLIPLLGVSGTCQVVAMLAAVAILPLLFAEYAPEYMPGLAVRGQQALPLPRLGWALTFLTITLGLLSLLSRGAEPEPLVHFDDATLVKLSGSSRFEQHETPFPHYLGSDGEGKAKTLIMATRPVAGEVRGFAGPINLVIAVNEAGILKGVRYLSSDETPAYIEGMGAWLERLAGSDLGGGALDVERLDGLSGATVTGRAALATINRAAREGGKAVFGKAFAAETPRGRTPVWRAPAFLATALLLMAFFPVYLSASERARLAYQVSSLLVLGLWLNTLVTEVDLVNLSLGRIPDVTTNPQRWLLLGFAGLTALLFGQVWCGYVCPFGALQELISRLGRRVYLRRYPERGLDTAMRMLKFLLLGALLIAVWSTGEVWWGSFDPMQHVFGGRWTFWMGLIIACTLVGALFYFRFWCRYFCPLGALLAFGNKIALLNRLGPKRRFDHCDLGVREEFDIDCIRCSRCLSGRDYGQRHRAKRKAGQAGAAVPDKL